MLRNTAVRALQDGCNRLNLPNSTAVELLQFLSSKRIHDQCVDGSKRQLNMSPGATVDKLWHFMLLNTAVSSQVHELLGGVVEHRGIDHTDLPDDTKLLQRLYSMNVMRLEGHEPQLELWTEPGTLMHTVQLTTDPVAALQHLPGGGRLYVTPTLTQQLQEQLVQALQLLYASSGNKGGNCVLNNTAQAAEAGRRRTRQEADTASPAVAAEAAEPKRARHAEGTGDTQQQPSHLPVTLETHNQQQVQQQGQVQEQHLEQQQEPQQKQRILIIIKDLKGVDVQFKVSPSTQVTKITDEYCRHKNLCPRGHVFIFDGQRWRSDKTVAWHEMEDGDTVDVFPLQTGC